MPRLARIKEKDGVYHVMVRSISEINLFQSIDDKKEYLNLVKVCKMMFKFKVYVYCLMDNHGHFIIDCNGADISKIMHYINFRYARYFNSKYKRHGHLFQDRFKSKLIKDNGYLYRLSLYIHYNPTDIKNFCDCPEKYKFSSLGVYIGLRKDEFNILSEKFIMNLTSRNKKKAKKLYNKHMKEFSVLESEEEIDEFINEETLYLSNKYIINRNYDVNLLLKFLSKKFNIDETVLFSKGIKKMMKPRALLIIMMRCLCGMSCNDICKFIGNITQSMVSKLTNKGLELMKTIDNCIYNEFFEFAKL